MAGKCPIIAVLLLFAVSPGMSEELAIVSGGVRIVDRDPEGIAFPAWYSDHGIWLSSSSATVTVEAGEVPIPARRRAVRTTY